MNLNEMTIEQLKALAYDLILQQQINQANLVNIEKMINEKTKETDVV